MRGVITISGEGIRVEVVDDASRLRVSFPRASVENLSVACEAAARLLGLSFEDLGAECRRIHEAEQELARCRDMIDEYLGGESSEEE